MQYNKQIQILKNTEQYRYLKDIKHIGNGYIEYKGEKLLNLSSNDYIGISQNKELSSEFISNLNNDSEYLFGSASSRLLSGNYNEYTELENTIAKAYGKEAALIYNSGYHANTGVLPALTTKKDLILSDKLNHASIVDGLKQSEATVIRYKHLDYSQIEQYLEKNRNRFRNVFIVSESIFSMDGDIVDLQKLINLKNSFDCILYLDEAHAVGAMGITGCGICEQENKINDIDIIIGTFGKAIGSVGAFVVTTNSIKEILINKSRTLIFTTGLPLVNVKWTQFVFDRLPEFLDNRKKLLLLSNKLRTFINENGLKTKGNSHIVPVITADNKYTIEIAELLITEGYYVSAVRPPTVPIGTSRIRLSLNSNLKIDDLQTVIKIISNKIN